MGKRLTILVKYATIRTEVMILALWAKFGTEASRKASM